MGLNYKNRLSDPIYGSILLSDLELSIIDSPAFQRLRNIKHLGLAHFVYPSAGFSRFSHSIGVCHVVGEMLNVLKHKGCRINDEEIDAVLIQKYRLAGLLHDIGHYPFSHCMEDAAKDYYSKKIFKDKKDEETTDTDQEADSDEASRPKALSHEQVGKLIVLNDPYISEIINNGVFTPLDIANIFTREARDPLADLISSDLDADRIDYLLRTAHHTGLPFGAIDAEYLISQIDFRDNQICYSGKAIKAVEHFLISRYFDYTKVAWHRSVAAFELIIKDVIAELVELGKLELSEANIINMIQDGEWGDFTDDSVMSLIREIRNLKRTAENENDKAILQRIESILNRRPPKLVAEIEFVDKIDTDPEKHFDNYLEQIKNIKGKISGDYVLRPDQWFTWLKRGDLSFTKIPSHMPTYDVTKGNTSKLRGKYEILTRILDKNNEPRSIIDVSSSMMHKFSDYALYIIRLYVLFENVESENINRVEIIKRFHEEYPDLPWTYIET